MSSAILGLSSGVLLGLLAIGSRSTLAQQSDEPASTAPLRVYVGTYTGGDSKGIYLMELDRRTGGARVVGLAAETESPSFLAIHPSQAYLYAVNEIGNFQGQSSGSVSAFIMNPVDGKLTLLNQQPSKGGAPCHIVIDKDGKHALVANYGGGSAAVLPILPDGTLDPATGFVQHSGSSVNPDRQTAPHAHSINLDSTNQRAYVADLGLDKVLIYKYDAEKGTITPNEPPFGSVEPGSGPRHFAFHPSAKYAFTNNEMTSSLTVFRHDPETGALEPLQTLSTLPADYQGDNSTAEVQVHPSGRFVYVSNRGHDSIAIFGFDAASGTLTHLGNQSTRGKVPRNFGIDPSGRFLLAANQESNSVAVFLIDEQTGKLRSIGDPYSVPKPVCIKFVTIGR